MPSSSIRIPVNNPNPHSGFTPRVIVALMISSVPMNTRTNPSTEASAKNVLYGWMKLHTAPSRKMIAITQWSHFHPSDICAAMNSLMQPNTNKAPIKKPTVATDVTSNRNTMTAMSSHARPVMRNTHHGTSDHPPMAPRPRDSISDMGTPSSIRDGRAAAAHGIVPQVEAVFHHPAPELGGWGGRPGRV